MMDLYESDLSLFGGDLLVGLSSPVDGDASLPSLEQDDYQLDILKPQVASSSSLAGELSLEGGFQLSTPAVPKLLSNHWLDENTDLLDLLDDNHSQLPIHIGGNDTDLAPLGMASPQQGSTALQILQSLADENGHELSSSPPPSSPSLVCSPAKPTIDGSSMLMGLLLDKTPVAGVDITKDTCMDVDVDEQLVLEASLAPILSPVSPDEVESLLSSGPCSPASTAHFAELVVPSASPGSVSTDNVSDVLFEDTDNSDETWLPSPPPTAIRSRRGSARSTPYHTKQSKLSKEAKQMERKQRKKQQNRDAALRYRQKKKHEVEGVSTECEKLEQRNRELQDKADQLSREIQYLKDLMAEVNRAKGHKK